MRAPAATASALIVALAVIGLTGCAPTGTPGTDDASQGSGTDAGDTDANATDTDDATGGDCVDPVLTDGPGTVTITVTADAMDPASVDIAVGDVVEFIGAGEGYHGLLVGTLSSVTVTPSLPEYYRFDAAGSCEASDELGSGTATINVG